MCAKETGLCKLSVIAEIAQCYITAFYFWLQSEGINKESKKEVNFVVIGSNCNENISKTLAQ